MCVRVSQSMRQRVRGRRWMKETRNLKNINAEIEPKTLTLYSIDFVNDFTINRLQIGLCVSVNEEASARRVHTR